MNNILAGRESSQIFSFEKFKYPLSWCDTHHGVLLAVDWGGSIWESSIMDGDEPLHGRIGAPFHVGHFAHHDYPNEPEFCPHPPLSPRRECRTPLDWRVIPLRDEDTEISQQHWVVV